MKKNKILTIMLAAVIAASIHTNSAFATSMQSVSLELSSVDTSSSTNAIKATFIVKNTGSTEINLPDLKIRYYFTIDNGSKELEFHCYNADIINPYRVITSNVAEKFVTMGTTMDGADTYLEISFDSSSGTLDVGQKVEIQSNFNRKDWSEFDQINDYSFNDANKTVIIVNGTIVSGIPPNIRLKVSYDANEGIGSAPVDSKKYDNNAEITIMTNTLTRDGYTFVGWNTAKDGKGTNVAPGSTFNIGNSNKTLYANWILNQLPPIVTNLKVLYDANEGIGSVPVDSNDYHENEEAITKSNTLTRDGYKFVGWNTTKNGDGVTIAPGNLFNIGDSNKTLYAKWILNSIPPTPPVNPETDNGGVQITTPSAVNIVGTKRVGKTLEAFLVDDNKAKFTTSSAVTYEWYRLSSEDSGNGEFTGNGNTYKLVSEDKGKYIKVVAEYNGKYYEEITERIAKKASSSSPSSSDSSSNNSNSSDATNNS